MDTTLIPWRELVINDYNLESYTLGEMVDNGTEIDIEMRPGYEGVSNWPDMFPIVNGEIHGWQWCEGRVDWNGFAEAIGFKSADECEE